MRLINIRMRKKLVLVLFLTSERWAVVRSGANVSLARGANAKNAPNATARSAGREA